MRTKFGLSVASQGNSGRSSASNTSCIRSTETGLALDHDAPRGAAAGFIAVDLEGDETIQHGACELGAGGAAEDEAAIIDDEVDREDVGLAGDVDSQPADGGFAEQCPTLGLTEDLRGLLSLVHATIQHDPGPRRRVERHRLGGASSCCPTGDGHVRTGAVPPR